MTTYTQRADDITAEDLIPGDMLTHEHSAITPLELVHVQQLEFHDKTYTFSYLLYLEDTEGLLTTRMWSPYTSWTVTR